MSDIEEDIEESEPQETGDFKCPLCKEPQPHFLNIGRGWARCPGCNKGVRTNTIPKEFLKEMPKEEKAKRDAQKKKSDEHNVESEQHDETEIEESKIPFKRSRERWQILAEILKKYSVKERAADVTIGRCKVRPMNAPEVEKMLNGLDTGLKKDECIYLVEDYHYAVEAEENQNRNTSRNPQYFGSREESSSSRANYDERDDKRESERRPWDKPKENDNKYLTKDDLLELLDRQEKKRAEEEKYKSIENNINSLGNMMAEIQSKLDGKNQQSKNNESLEMMKMMMQMNSDNKAELNKLMLQQQQQQNELYKEMLRIQQNAMEKSNTQVIAKGSDEYNEDGAKLLANAMNNVTNLAAKNQPFKELSKVVAKANNPIEEPSENKVKRKKGGDMDILDGLEDEGLVDTDNED